MSQHVESPTRKDTVLDLIFGNEAGQVVEGSVGEYFGDNDHNLVKFKVVIEKDKDVLEIKVLN